MSSDHDILVRLEEKVDAFIQGHIDHEGRIRKVESDAWKMKGALAILVFLAGLIEPVLIWVQRGHK